jgi:hypothetical protein
MIRPKNKSNKQSKKVSLIYLIKNKIIDYFIDIKP